MDSENFVSQDEIGSDRGALSNDKVPSACVTKNAWVA